MDEQRRAMLAGMAARHDQRAMRLTEPEFAELAAELKSVLERMTELINDDAAAGALLIGICFAILTGRE
jgi:hypothetical protein